MIGNIGLKRIIVLIAFLAINVSLSVSLYMYLLPELSKQERVERKMNSDVRRIRADIDHLHLEFQQLDQQKDSYDALRDKGFFSVQLRSDAKKMFSDLQNESNVVSAVVNVKPGVVADDQDAKIARHKVLISVINIDIEAFDDVDIYRYISLLEKTFPGHVSVDVLEIKRVRDVSGPILRSISSGANPVMVKAKLKLSWQTMVSEDILEKEGE